jgi:RNA polymerase-binding transcription factor DksA
MVAPKSIYAREEVKLPKGAVFCPLSGIVVTPQKANISPKTLERLRALLEEEMTKHTRQADDLRAEADQLASEREQGDTQFDEESGEGDTVSVERERDLLLSATARQTVDEIRAALERMDAGTYGLCTPAGRRITMARLDAIPWADQCVDCKSARERRR